MKILTAAQMQQVDRLTSERFSLPGLTLMETAGNSAVVAMAQYFPSLSTQRVQIFCGKGNNGGDGAVVARLLWLKGTTVELYLLGSLSETKGDAYTNFATVKELATVESPKLSYYEITTLEDLHIALNRSCDLYIDALFGTGASRPLTGIYQELVEALNQKGRPIIAIDIPSGLGADSPDTIGATIKAQLTITMTAPKIANVLPPARHYNGSLVVAPIGSPSTLINNSGTQLNLLEDQEIAQFLNNSRRSSSFFKNSVGHVLVIAGSRGKIGAAGLSAEAVLRAGAGLATVAIPQSSQVALVSALPLEIMTEALAETTQGTIACQALDTILKLWKNKQIAALGPGLGVDEDTKKLVRELVAQRLSPLVIDADGLNCLAPWPAGLQGNADKPIILTPHPGEMARLVGVTTSDISKSRIDIARKFAVDHQVILVLKGERSLIAAPDGEVYINPTGNAGMATAGSGDVLTGILAGLLAQAPQQALQATCAAVYLHGLAGDIAAKALGQRSLVASELTKYLATAILTVGGDREKGDVADSLS